MVQLGKEGVVVTTASSSDGVEVALDTGAIGGLDWHGHGHGVFLAQRSRLEARVRTVRSRLARCSMNGAEAAGDFHRLHATEGNVVAWWK